MRVGLRRLRSQFTYANVCATLALVIAIGTGTSYAATKLIAGKQIAANAITSKQIAAGSIELNDLSPAARAALRGAKGEAGEAGTAGAAGGGGTNGAAGAAGTNGSRGDKGDRGDKGERGEQGMLGATGATGATGTAGTAGTAGAQGIQGLQGGQGTKGDTGDGLSGSACTRLDDRTGTNRLWFDPSSFGTTFCELPLLPDASEPNGSRLQGAPLTDLVELLDSSREDSAPVPVPSSVTVTTGYGTSPIFPIEPFSNAPISADVRTIAPAGDQDWLSLTIDCEALSKAGPNALTRYVPRELSLAVTAPATLRLYMDGSPDPLPDWRAVNVCDTLEAVDTIQLLVVGNGVVTNEYQVSLNAYWMPVILPDTIDDGTRSQATDLTQIAAAMDAFIPNVAPSGYGFAVSFAAPLLRSLAPADDVDWYRLVIDCTNTAFGADGIWWKPQTVSLGAMGGVASTYVDGALVPGYGSSQLCLGDTLQNVVEFGVTSAYAQTYRPTIQVNYGVDTRPHAPDTFDFSAANDTAASATGATWTAGINRGFSTPAAYTGGIANVSSMDDDWFRFALPCATPVGQMQINVWQADGNPMAMEVTIDDVAQPVFGNSSSHSSNTANPCADSTIDKTILVHISTAETTPTAYTLNASYFGSP